MTETKNAAEAARLAELARLKVMDTGPEEPFEDLVERAAIVMDAPIALISLIDAERQWFKARVGVDLAETPREHAFCNHAIRTPSEVMVVPDATKDERFATNPMVTGAPHIRFYAGAPLVTEAGLAIGTLCILDSKPRVFNPENTGLMQFMARQVVRWLETRAKADPEEGLVH